MINMNNSICIFKTKHGIWYVVLLLFEYACVEILPVSVYDVIIGVGVRTGR